MARIIERKQERKNWIQKRMGGDWSQRIYRLLMQALKIAIGSCIAIYIAEMMHLQYAISAGSITLLTIVTTKWETVRLSFYRVITFALSAVLACVTFRYVYSEWVAYGIYIFLIVIICNICNWTATISVNAVIGTHFLTTLDFSPAFIRNEFFLVLIGISVALVLNLFHDYRSQKRRLIQYMRETEEELQKILGEMAVYLHNQELSHSVWDDICALEERMRKFLTAAHEYQDNTFQSHPQYYIDYFEMRLQQCSVLHNLHYEMRKIRTQTRQANIIANFILDMKQHVVELNDPKEQLDLLELLFDGMRRSQLPKTREEFESRAMLYHILMDLEEFLIFKRRFVEGLDEQQRKIYWDE